MKRKLLVSSLALFLAFLILTISVFRTAAIKHEFVNNVGETISWNDTKPVIEYSLAHHGSVLPNSKLWWLKASRDGAWLRVTTNSDRKAELLLLFADKRLSMAKVLLEQGNYDIGLSTLSKAEKYLEQAAIQEEVNRRSGSDTSEFLQILATASLKHREVVEFLARQVPSEASTYIISLTDYSKNSYESAMHGLNEKGIAVPANPF